MLAHVLREVYANNQFLLFRWPTPAQYFPSRHAGTPRINSCLRRNFRRNVHGFQSGNTVQMEEDDEESILRTKFHLLVLAKKEFEIIDNPR